MVRRISFGLGTWSGSPEEIRTPVDGSLLLDKDPEPVILSRGADRIDR